MRYILALTALFFCKISFSQNPAQINLKDSCILTGGIIKLTDFKKLCKICPPNVQKVISFNVSYPLSPPIYGELPCKGNRYNMSVVVPSAKVGNVVSINAIKAIGKDGKPIEVRDITLGFK
jgi:hypothetical protein